MLIPLSMLLYHNGNAWVKLLESLCWKLFYYWKHMWGPFASAAQKFLFSMAPLEPAKSSFPVLHFLLNSSSSQTKHCTYGAYVIHSTDKTRRFLCSLNAGVHRRRGSRFTNCKEGIRRIWQLSRCVKQGVAKPTRSTVFTLFFVI